MAFSLIAESADSIDWKSVAEALGESGGAVEYFPIPADGDDTGDAIGISIPVRADPSSAWCALERSIPLLTRVFGLRVTELYTGSEVGEADLPRLKGLIFGPG